MDLQSILLQWMVILLLHDKWLCAYRCLAQIHHYTIFKVATPFCLGIINYRFHLLIQICPDSSLVLLLLLLTLPMHSNKSVKAPFTALVMYEKIQYSAWVSHANTALSFTSCHICQLTPPLVLSLPYITHNGALTYMSHWCGLLSWACPKYYKLTYLLLTHSI